MLELVIDFITGLICRAATFFSLQNKTNQSAISVSVKPAGYITSGSLHAFIHQALYC